MEFTKSEMVKLRYNMINVLANEVAECGPFKIEKTPKMFKITNGDSVVYRRHLDDAIKIVDNERSRNGVAWLAKYGNNIYTKNAYRNVRRFS